MADQQKVAYGLSNGAIFNDFERPLTWFSKSCRSWTLNISQTATDVATVTIDKCKKLQFIHKLTASDTSKTAKITKR